MAHTRRTFIRGVGAAAAVGCTVRDDDPTLDLGGVFPPTPTTPTGSTGHTGGGDTGEAPLAVDLGRPFGISTSHSRSWNLEWLEPLAAAGFTHLRGFDRANPDPGLALADKLGVEVTGILQQGGAFPADTLDDWQKHVTGLVTPLADRVRSWEVWNEPPNFSSDKSPESYAAIVVAAYDAVKAIDPDIQVAICAASVHLNFVAQALKAGAAGHFDYVTLHPYETLGLVDRGFEAMFMAIRPTVRAMLADLDPDKVDVPLVFTELGTPVQGETTPEAQASTFVKSYVLSLAQGVSRIHWFEGRDGDSGPFGLYDAAGDPRVSFTAASHLLASLGPRPGLYGWILFDDAHPGFVFDDGGEAVMVAWARPGTPPTVDAGGPVQLLDPLTGKTSTATGFTLSTTPTIVRGLPIEWVAAAAASRQAAFPWDGTFGGATEVSVTPAGEQGLHMLGTPPRVTVDGVEAFDMGAGAGWPFTVDPTFLVYDAVPLRVTVEVRRKVADAAAGFNVKYEAIDGTHGTGGWNGVPAGDTWHTLTWDIDDPQFVGHWR